MSRTLTARCAIVSLCSTERVTHLRNQLRAVQGRPDIRTIVVWIDGTTAPPLSADEVVLIPPGRYGMKLAAARNAGAERAIESGADLMGLVLTTGHSTARVLQHISSTKQALEGVTP